MRERCSVCSGLSAPEEAAGAAPGLPAVPQGGGSAGPRRALGDPSAAGAAGCSHQRAEHFQQRRDTQNTNALYSFRWLLTLQHFLKCFKIMMTGFFFNCLTVGFLRSG